jgi:hypothetical protein
MDKSSANELAYVQTCIGEMEPYLLSKELFWPLSGREPGGSLFTRLTIGGLLLSLHRLQAADDSGSLSASQIHQFNKSNEGFGVVQSKWRVALEDKSKREFSSRINQWRNYLDELVERPVDHAVFYPAEVRLRVIIQLLKESIADPASQDVEHIAYLDRRLRRIFTRGEFIWEFYLESAFAEDAFWFLYGTPKRLLNIDCLTLIKNDGSITVFLTSSGVSRF